VGLLWDLLGVRMSLGAVSSIEQRVSEAVAPAVEEAWEHVLKAKVKHTDGTSWLQAGVMLSLWTIATSLVTVFKIIANGQRATLKAKLFTKVRGILVSDRAKTLKFWAMEKRQICWAHLLRKFISFSERDGPAGAIGRELLEYTGIAFEYWSDYKAGKISRKQFRAWMVPVRFQLEALLERAVAADIKELSGSCADILEHRAALWTFVDHDGVEPTNNHAERELRAFVLWRKRSFGSQSERGNRFAERLMTIAHTARKQNKNVLAFLVACCEPRWDESSTPSLFDPTLAVAKAA
jgi:transposase